MTEFTFITINDIHISDNGPRSRLDDFKSTVLGKLAQVRAACSKLNADALLIAGDLYNLKNPSKNSHRLNQELIKEFKQFSCPIYMVEGNHDLWANKVESLTEQPLGVLFADKTLIQLREEIISKNEKKISLVGIPYTENIDLSAIKLPEKGDCVSQICVMHIYAGLTTGMLFKERLYGYDELEKLNADIYVLGHYHVDQGIYNNNGKHFLNIGSLTRGVLSEENIDHHPQMGYIRIEIDDNNKISYNIRTIKLKIKPASEIFDLSKREEEQQESLEIQHFVEKLASEAVKSSNPSDSIDDIINKMDIAKIVKEKAMRFIQKAAALK